MSMGKVSSYKTGDIAQDIYERVKIQIPGIYILHQPKRKSPWYIQIKRDLPAGVKKNHFYRTVDEAIEAYNRFADIVVRQEAEFLLTPTERQAIRLWRRHREKRMQEGKKSQTLEEAIRYAMDAEHKQDIARRTIEDLFHEYSLYKEKEAETKKGDTAVKQCRHNLADTKRMLDLSDAIYIDELGSVEVLEEVESLLRDTVVGRDGGLPSQTTIKHYRTALNTFLNWCEKRAYITRNPIALLPPIQAEEPTRESYAPQELLSLLHTAIGVCPKAIPWLITAAFMGVRPRELTRLTWREIGQALGNGFLKIEHVKSKTGQDRLIPVNEAFRAWMTWWLQKKGKQSGYLLAGDTREQREWNQGRDIMTLKEAGIEWKKDGLRHSYGTYMCAIEPNTSVVAKAMGNSVEILLKHYVQAKTDKEGESYFAIRPQNQQ